MSSFDPRVSLVGLEPGRYERRRPSFPRLQDFEQVGGVPRRRRRHHEVVDDEQLHTLTGVHVLAVAPVGCGAAAVQVVRDIGEPGDGTFFIHNYAFSHAKYFFK